MSIENNIALLVEIIKDYRIDELHTPLDAEHVQRWLKQFETGIQDVVLSETLHIFKSYYFNKNKICEILDNMILFLQRKYGFKTIQDLVRNVSFVASQTDGKSQKMLVEMLEGQIFDKYNENINKTIHNKFKHYVYIDDGIYTGSRAKADLERLISEVNSNSTLDVFYIVAGQNGLNYVKEILTKLAKESNITIEFYKWKLLQNDKRVSYYSGCENYFLHQVCLWPEKALNSNEIIKKYQKKYEEISPKHEKRPYRVDPWHNDAGIFTSVENRNIVEKEFLIQGIKIVEKVFNSKGMYPLGYNLWPSFGFGSFCAFDMNISNTCPLVLWWGNPESDCEKLNLWYPLLPRRTKADASQMANYEVFANEYEKIYQMDQYNICPECGEYFGIEKDGGNGFCVQCSWKH